jgi:TonB-dependent starch-binding outer membrane protein SusC
MKKIHTLLILLSFFSFVHIHAQTITGTVTDVESKIPLPGVNILIEGSTIGAVTDISGNYSINVPDTNSILIFSFISYLEEKIVVGNQQKIDISMIPDIHNLEEIVVIGYGSQPKSDITGSVASVNPADVNPGPVLSVDNILQNTAPGVVLIQSSAQPGGGFDIKIRGTSSLLGDNGPLYVVDGLPITSDNSEPESGSRYRSSPTKNPLNGINPDDIVSIEILKDASATAIYGARGANGVILITTKRGKTGKMTVDYAGSYSLQKLDNEYDMLNAKEFASLSNKYHLEKNPASDPLYSPAEINQLGQGTVWMDKITQLGAINKHQLALSAGKEKYNIYASANYFQHKGIVQVSDLQRFSGRVNATVKPIKHMNIGVNIIGTNMQDTQVPFGATDGGGPEFAGLFDNTRTWSPLALVHQPDGSFFRHPVVDNIPNPVSLLDIDDQIWKNRLMGNVFVDYTLMKKLTAKINVGYDQTKSNRESYIPTTVIRGEQANGEAEIAHAELHNMLAEFTLNYSSTLFRNNLTLLGGTTYQQFDSEGDNLLLSNFADHASSIDEIQTADTLSNTKWKERSRLLSYLGRLNYNIKDRYLFTFSFRADGSTKFGPNNKWGFFPSAAFGWKIHNEQFFNSQNIKSFKFRFSYGQTGNQEIGNKQSQSLYSYTRRTVIGGVPVSGLASLRPQNDNLKWETSTQLNTGIDISFYEGRIQSTLDLYRKVTTNVILSYELSSTTGYDFMTANTGEILNRGVELGIKSVNINLPIKWTTSFNIAYNKNSWLDRAGYYPVSPEVEEENAVLNGIYGYVVEGIFKTQSEIDQSMQPNASLGMYKFKDVDEDGHITPGDRTLLGKNDPDYTFGLNNDFTYKRFNLSFFFQGMLGREKDNFILADLEDIQNILSAYNKSTTILDRWTPDNPGGSIHSGVAPSDGGDNHLNSVYIQDASFIRLRNITLGYTITSLKFIDYLRVYLDAQNLLTFTNYGGLDPETDEFRQYPNAKTYTIGVNVTF